MAHLHELIAAQPSTAAAVGGVLAMLLFYLAAWWLYGRDPPRGTIIPQFAAPDGLAPDAVRYLYAMACDRKVFAAALVNMAVGGYLKIRQDGDSFTLEHVQQAPVDALPPSEGRGREGAVRDGAGVARTEAFQRRLRAGRRHQAGPGRCASNAARISQQYGLACGRHRHLHPDRRGGDPADGRSGRHGGRHRVPGDHGRGDMGRGRGTGKLWTGLRRKHGVGSVVWAVLATVLVLFFGLLFILTAVFGFRAVMPFATTGTLLLGAAMAWAFYYLLKAPTALGVGVFDKIDGFRMFLMASEKDRLEMLNPPTVTPELFEKFLPYASR